MTGKTLLVMYFYSVMELCLGPPKKQYVVTLSTTEAEFVAVASYACQGVDEESFGKLGHFQDKCITMLCDNSSTIKLIQESNHAWTQQTH